MRPSVASGLGLGSRVNTILQTCFFALSGVMPRDKAIEAIKRATEKTYAKKGKAIVEKNFAAIDSAVANLHEVRVPAKAAGQRIRLTLVPDYGAGVRPQRDRRRSSRCAATRFPSARFPWTAPIRPARPGTRSGTSPTRCRSGNPTSASSAASARSSVRTA